MTAAVRQLALRIDDASQVASARRAVSDMTHFLGFDETHVGKAALLTTELATNILKHADSGEILARPLTFGDSLGVEILAVDSGPGIESLHESLIDGVSSSGTSGTGLGAMKRIANEFLVHTQAGKGTAVCLRLWDAPQPSKKDANSIGVVCIPYPGETECGDAWNARLDENGGILLVADGLGHGPEAAEAAEAAAALVEQHPYYTPSQLIEQAHRALRHTRGAAVAVARLDRRAGLVTYAGVGNIAAILLQRDERRQLVSHAGIVGSNVRKIQEFTVPWGTGDTLILHSDGLASQWSLDAYPGIASYDPSIIAATLYRDYWRRRDDVTVAVFQ